MYSGSDFSATCIIALFEVSSSGLRLSEFCENCTNRLGEVFYIIISKLKVVGNAIFNSINKIMWNICWKIIHKKEYVQKIGSRSDECQTSEFFWLFKSHVSSLLPIQGDFWWQIAVNEDLQSEAIGPSAKHSNDLTI